MKFLHTKETLNVGDILRIQASHNCTIRLLDDDNFNLYKKGKEHEYHGGLFEIFPATIPVPSTKDWNIAIVLPDSYLTHFKYNITVTH